MSISNKQIEAIMNLPPPQRYSHFIKKVVGWKCLWALYDDGWAMSEMDGGSLIFPIWPEKEYAERCISGDWAKFHPKAIDLDEALNDMLPMLRERNILPGVFFLPEFGSISVTVEELERDLREELSKYE